LQPGLQRRVIRQAIQRLVPGLRDIDFEVSELVSALAGKKSAARPFALVDDILTLREAGTLFIYKGGTSLPDGTWPQLIEKNPQNLVVPGHLDLKNGWLLVTDFVEIDNPLEAVQNLPPQEVWLDVDCLHLPLQVRALRPGDRFQPIGMLKGTIKVSDFFTNQKVPPRARQFWPLVYSGDSLIWIAGLRTAQHTSLTTHTRRVARLRILEPGSSDVSQ
jgi:tRNA(Ile)-lysidine synthase